MNLADRLRQAGVARGDLAALVVSGEPPSLSLSVAVRSATLSVTGSAEELAEADSALRPRWVLWSSETAALLVGCGVRLATCWEIAAAHRLIFGGWQAGPGLAWAMMCGLPPQDAPVEREPDLFWQPDNDMPNAPVDPSGYLHPSWVAGGWSSAPQRSVQWAELALRTAIAQRAVLSGGPSARRAQGTGPAGPGTAPVPGSPSAAPPHLAPPAGAPGLVAPPGPAIPPRAVATVMSESAAELLCAELSSDGLPMSRSRAEEILVAIIGSRPRSEAEGASLRAERDAKVLEHAPRGLTADLRSPAQVRWLLNKVGVDVPDTRAYRLRDHVGTHPLVAALLDWRKAERIATTYGYSWLDQHLGADGRLRGAWTGCDGAAGRMTASGGLHNMPAAMRAAVIADDGWIFVRADLGQIEPRVLAAVSGDKALAEAAAADDLYAPVAAQLGVDRPTAKVAVLGAMYGQTTGHGAQALRRLKAAYPVAMNYLDQADEAGRTGRDLRTFGGRLISFGRSATAQRAAAMGRYGRNALIQGAAAEFFKIWAVTVRARAASLDARVVLCLHDELLVHCPAANGPAVAALVEECLREAAHRWSPPARVRFLADTTAIRTWSAAKIPSPPGPGLATPDAASPGQH